MTWTETMEVRDRGSTFNPLFISFFSSQVKWKLLYYSAFLLQKINRHHPASYFSSNNTWIQFEDYMICLVEGCMSGCVYTLYDTYMKYFGFKTALEFIISRRQSVLWSKGGDKVRIAGLEPGLLV